MTTAAPPPLKTGAPRIAVCEVCKQSFTARNGNRKYCFNPDCKKRRKRIENKQQTARKNLSNMFSGSGYPLPEWRTKRDDLTEQEILNGSNSPCFHCIHLRACQHQVRESARRNKMLATKCGF